MARRAIASRLRYETRCRVRISPPPRKSGALLEGQFQPLLLVVNIIKPHGVPATRRQLRLARRNGNRWPPGDESKWWVVGGSNPPVSALQTPS